MVLTSVIDMIFDVVVAILKGPSHFLDVSLLTLTLSPGGIIYFVARASLDSRAFSLRF